MVQAFFSASVPDATAGRQAWRFSNKRFQQSVSGFHLFGTMADIKYTLSRGTRYRAETPEQERDWLGRVHELCQAIPTKPLRAGIGDYAYFIHGGKVKARARIVDVVRVASR